MSAYRSSKRPPHIVFLVDTSPFLYTNNTLDDSSVTSLQAMILRILLYYVDMVDDRTTWGFRFFNTNSASITMSNRRFLPVSSQSIQDFLKELFIKVDQERAKPPTTNDTDSCYSNLKQTLMQTLAEFRWKDIDLLGASPRSQSIPNSTKSVTIKNYMYVVSHRPHTMDDLQHYMGESTAMVDKHRVLTCIQKIADDLKRWLWDDYANHQISINWIDREDTKTHKEVDLLIQTGFGSIMQMFGGHLITETMLKQDYAYWGLSFGTVFDHYRSLSMDATPELKLPILPDPKGKKLISNDKSNNSNNQIDTPIWSGPLISKTTNEDHLQTQINTKTQPQTY
ncbi:hypothetical protein BC941DRAFT_100947 [Chlamydoabsidia padenii]|nr:hypothetical protein BC941DRAFT_100947 [Chlamydoabsidia padenii]